MKRITFGGLALLCGMSFAGCSRQSLPWPIKDESSPLIAAPATAVQVKVDGYGRPVGESQIPIIKPDDFLRNIEKLLAEGRTLSARNYVLSRLDTACEVLKQTEGTASGTRAAIAVATTYDQLLGLPAQSGWAALLSDRVNRPQAYAVYDVARRETLDKLRAGTSAQVDTQRLVAKASDTKSTMLMLDAYQMHGVSLLVSDQPARAVEAFTEGQRIAVPVDGQQAVQFGLLLSDALRRTGEGPAADRMWLQTVTAAAELAQRPSPVVDPTFWDKAAYLRPFSSMWPAAVTNGLSKHACYLGTDPFANSFPTSPGAEGENPEVVVWGCIGQTLLERDDCQAALVAFKRAESASRNAKVRDWLRHSQAKTFAQLGQSSAATALWVQLSQNQDPTISKAATASLGGMKLRQGDLQAGHKLLSKGLADPPVDWPDRGNAEADFALTVLMRGDTNGGLSRLHIAQERFKATNNSLALANSVWNEAKFLEHAGRKGEAASAWTRWRQLEQGVPEGR